MQNRTRYSGLHRIFAVLFIAVLTVSACSKGQDKAELNREKEQFSLSIMAPLHQARPPKDELIEELEKTTQTKLNIEWVPNDIYRDRLINALETNSLKKVTYVSQLDYVAVKNAIRSNMFWEIGSYLDSFPNLKTLDKHILDETTIDGKIYGIYTERPASRQGIILRKDWLNKLQLKEPKTTEELYQVLKQFTYGDPDGNGRDDTFGLADRNDLIFGAFKTLSSYFGTPNNWVVRDGKLIPDFTTPEYLDTMNFMKRLYNENLVNKDFPVTSKQVQRYMLISGKAGAIIGSMTDAPRLSDELKKINPQAELTLVNRISGPKGYGVWSIPSFSGIFLFSKKAIPTEEELRKVLAFYDRMMSPDASNLLQYGLLGKHYTVKDGKALIINVTADSRNAEVMPLEALLIANLSNPGILKVHEEAQDPLIVLADKLTTDNSRMLITDPAENLSSATYDARGADLWQIIYNATYNYIIGRIDGAGFQSEIANWERKGGSQVLDEYNEALKNNMARKK
ncbi:extracellular solute-binding protein [Paenibacillus thalictri]|uniref:Extracellular solute-binding protein n=1 Tax=Paenibacillus thalictri TaxID=2527873 RepID=A0A4V2J3T0_9BACL|nr:extracellular solute-binding protein [Paenibacillus thalictri]TBL75296.1 extracellular solute-binding protein [Paenibacillus thalictri]